MKWQKRNFWKLPFLNKNQNVLRENITEKKWNKNNSKTNWANEESWDYVFQRSFLPFVLKIPGKNWPTSIAASRRTRRCVSRAPDQPKWVVVVFGFFSSHQGFSSNFAGKKSSMFVAAFWSQNHQGLPPRLRPATVRRLWRWASRGHPPGSGGPVKIIFGPWFCDVSMQSWMVFVLRNWGKPSGNKKKTCQDHTYYHMWNAQGFQKLVGKRHIHISWILIYMFRKAFGSGVLSRLPPRLHSEGLTLAVSEP